MQKRGKMKWPAETVVLLYYVAAHNVNVTGRVCYLT
jgi:hypothetical protein